MPADREILRKSALLAGFTEFLCEPGGIPRARRADGVIEQWSPLTNADDARLLIEAFDRYDNRPSYRPDMPSVATLCGVGSIGKVVCSVEVPQQSGPGITGEEATWRRAVVTCAAAMHDALEVRRDPLETRTELDRRRLLARHGTTSEQMTAMARDLCLWMYDHDVKDFHISRTPGTAKFLTTIDGKSS